MKKTMLLAAVLCLVLASCGNKSQQGDATTADSTATVENTENQDGNSEALGADAQTAIDQATASLQKALETKDAKATAQTIAQLTNTYKKLVEQGKMDEAKAYGEAIKNWVKSNEQDIKSIANGDATIGELVNGIQNLPTSASATAEQAKAAAEQAANAISNAPAAVKQAAEQAANQAAANVKTAAENKAKEEANKINEKVSTAKENAKAKATEKVNEAKAKANEAATKAANKAIKDIFK